MERCVPLRFRRFRALSATAAIGLLLTSQPATLAGVVVGHVDVEPDSGSHSDTPTTAVLGQTPGTDLFVSHGNRGDWDLGLRLADTPPAGRPMLQAEGVLIPSLPQSVALPHRGGLEAPGELTKESGNAANGGIWVAGWSALEGGMEANYDFAFAYFPFADGWVGGHVPPEADRFLATGSTLPQGATVELITKPPFDGEVLLRLPGIHSVEDGLLFTVAAGNADDTTAVGPKPDGSGWHIRVADESNDYRQEQRSPFSFLFVPYNLEGLSAAGWIDEAGNTIRGSGSFGVTHTGTGRYELFVPDRGPEDGILLVEIVKLNKEGVEDNTIAWHYSEQARQGRGAFVVETYDQPGLNDQDVKFGFAFIEFENQLHPERRRVTPGPHYTVTGDWAGSLRKAAEFLTTTDRPEAEFRPFFSPVLAPASSPAPRIERPVRGVRHLWLRTTTAGPGGAGTAQWLAPTFVLDDGSHRRLSPQDVVFARGAAASPGPDTTTSEAPLDMAVSLDSTVCVRVPENADTFATGLGVAAEGKTDPRVMFSLLDQSERPHPWSTHVLPELHRAYPVETARFERDLEALGLPVGVPDCPSWPRVLAAGLASLRGDLMPYLGPDWNKVGEDAASDALETYARAYAVAARVEQRLLEVTDLAWEAVPELARYLDYPRLDLHGLRERLQGLTRGKPGLESSAAAYEAILDACTERRNRILEPILTDDSSDDQIGDLDTLVSQLQLVARWLDRHEGWPAHLADNQRSGTSHAPLPFPLNPVWNHIPMAPPAPAWPPPRTDNPAVNQLLSPTLTYDHAHHPVIAGNRLYYGSSADGSVVCLDAETGEFRWRFATEGPVRLAPRLTRGRILAASDDGLLYCLDAETGASLWTYRPGPEDRRLMGNGRPMSVWPIRCGICVRDGTAYVAAGLFPSHGTYLCAVDVETGEEEWKRPLDCSPQGFMLASPDRLFVPTGRTPFRVYRRSDGQPLATLGRSDSWGKSLPGGCCAVVVDEQLVTGPGEDGDLYVFDVTSAETLVRAPGTQIVVDGLVTYALGDRKISALERSYLQGSQPKVLWEQTCGKAHCLIRTAEHLCVGTDAGVEVISSTNGEHRGRVPFPAPVLGLAIAESRLYAATADGRIHCLSNRTPEAPLTHRLQAEPAPDTADADQTMAREALDLLGSTQGVCLIVGADTTDLARELAASSRLQVIQAVTDPAVAHSLRQALAEQGLLGQGIALHTVGVPALPYQRHLANLVIDLTLHDTAADAVPDTELLRVLRPYGGLLLQRRQALPDALPPGQPIRTGPESAFGAAFRRGHVPGAGSWTHCYADLGNTACSGDLTPFTEYGLLWFGRPGPRRMLERHIKGAPPLAADGLLFITGKDYLAGLDAYNGTILWEKDVPGSGRVGVLKDCGNMALAPDSLYVACDSACLLLDPSTGNQRAAIDVESVAGVPGHWGYTAWIGDLLLGTRTPPGAELQAGDAEDYTTIWKHHRPVVCSSHLFAADRHNGTRLWCHAPEPGLIANPTITVLGDRVFFLESTNPEPRRQDLGKVPLADLFANGPRVTALDLRTGEVAWSAAVDLSLFHHSLYMSGKDGTLVLCGSRHAPVDGQELIQYELLALDAGNGDLRWQNSNTPTRAHILDGGHGEQIQHPAIVGETVYGPGFARNLHTGEVVDGWLWNKSPQCATLSASATCAFSRQNGLPTVEAFADGSKLHLTRTTRPGCWINTLPIGGMVVIPEASSGCTCGYSVQASLGLAPR